MFGTRASLFVDLFLLALVVCLAAMLVGVRFVRKGDVRAHAAVMVSTFALFVLAVVAFEVAVRFGDPVTLPAAPLVIHLCLAVPCLLLWTRQIWLGRRALLDPAPHRRRGRILLVLLSLTVATGFWLYVATFV